MQAVEREDGGMTDVWAEAVTFEPATYDLTKADYALHPLDERGLTVSISCWDGRRPRVGDYLILRNRERATLNRVTSVDLCMNVDPPTMWIAHAEFAPRPLSETGAGATDRK
jgi:hypothetical protein